MKWETDLLDMSKNPCCTKRHNDSEHKGKYACLIGESRGNKISALKSSVKQQQNSMKVQVQTNESVVRASLRVAEILAKAGR